MAAKGTEMTHVVHLRPMVFRRGTWRSLIIVAMLGTITAGLTGCSHSLTAQSSCKDFLNASQSDQIQAIDKIAAQVDAPDATTPLGMPNISYLCTGSPNQTLGWAITQSR